MISGCRVILCLFLLFLSGGKSVAQDLEFKVTESGINSIGFHLPDVNSGDSLAVYREGASREVFGRWSIRDGFWIFEPYYSLPFATGFKVLREGEELYTFITPAGSTDVPQVLAIHPARDTLPANLLKMQIVFSAPMRSGVSSNYIRWSRSGVEIESLFLDLSPELWNPSYDTLTMWLNPGRIKRDLIPNKTMGNPLDSGKEYTVYVLPGWPSASGNSIDKGFSKTFYVEEFDVAEINPEDWKLQLPSAGSAENLVITTDGILDLYSALNGLEIRDNSGRRIVGSFGFDAKGNITFDPVNSWLKGEYVLFIDESIEDMAGNRQDRLFDEDLRLKSRSEALTDHIEFSIK